MANQKPIGCAYEDQKIVGGTIDNTVIGATTKAAASVTALTATGTATLSGNLATGTNGSSTVGFYGSTPISQRASAVQAASVVSVNSWISVTSNVGAFASEVAQTLTALGLWKGSA
jgi:hypothetical protein